MSETLRSGVITVTTAGTAVQGTAVSVGSVFGLKPLASNTGKIYVGNDGAGDVSSANGFPLDVGEMIIITGTLSTYYFDSSVNGEGVIWLMLG